MKKKLTILFLLLFTGLLTAQIPNAGFEEWTNNDPNNWYTIDILYNAVSQSDDAYSGNYAAKIENYTYNEGIFTGLMQSLFPVSESHPTLTGYFKFFPQTEKHVLEIHATAYNANSEYFGIVGAGTFETNATISSYTQFNVPIDYFSDLTADSIQITIMVSDTSEDEGTETSGAYAFLDDLSFGGATSVEMLEQNPGSFSLKQNYPNPFNPSTKIQFSVPEESFVELKVFDILGKELALITSDVYSAGSYKLEFDANNLTAGRQVLPSGIYIAKINVSAIRTGNSFSKSIKMNFIK